MKALCLGLSVIVAAGAALADPPIGDYMELDLDPVHHGVDPKCEGPCYEAVGGAGIALATLSSDDGWGIDFAINPDVYWWPPPATEFFTWSTVKTLYR